MPLPNGSVPILCLSIALLSGCATAEEERRHDAFCSDGPSLLRDVGARLVSVPPGAEDRIQVLDESVALLEDVQVPEDAADEWDRLLAALHDVRDVAAQAGPAGAVPDGLRTELRTAGAAVESWGVANC